MIYINACINLYGILIGTVVELFKEKTTPKVPLENWGNKALWQEDIRKGVPVEQRMKNLRNGKYRQTETYPEPHRNENGKIIIENCLLFEQDKEMFGVSRAYEWAKQGRYNLEGKALEEERKRIKEKNKWLYE